MIAYLTSWGLFWMGDALARVMNNTLADVLYPAYNWCMTTSYYVQVKYKVHRGPWHDFTAN